MSAINFPEMMDAEKLLIGENPNSTKKIRFIIYQAVKQLNQLIKNNAECSGKTGNQ
jgi:hypothetical protein